MPVRYALDASASLGERIDRVELHLATQATWPFQCLLFASRKYCGAITSVWPTLGKTVCLAVAGDHGSNKCIRIRKRRQQNDRTVADDTGRAMTIMEAHEDLAKVFVLDQIDHRCMATGDEQANIALRPFRDHRCQRLRVLELIDTLSIDQRG